MQFNFVLTNHGAATLQALDDILRPLMFGLRAAGHRVVAGARRFAKAPVINVMVEDFGDPAVVQQIHGARAAAADAFRLGVVLPPGVEADMTGPRLEGLRAVRAAVDFVWTVAPAAAPPDFWPSDRVAALRYGFDESLIGPRLIADPAARDIDVVVYGPNGQRLDALVAQLAAAQLRHFPVRVGTFPDYIVTDLLSRAKLVAVVGPASVSATPLGPYALKAVCNGALVAVEAGSVSDPLSGVVAPCAYDDVPGHCRRIIGDGRFLELGLGALEQLRRGPGMRDGLEAALAVAGAWSGHA